MEKEEILQSVTASEPYFHLYVKMQTRVKENGEVIATSNKRVEILCGDWAKAEEYNLTDVAKSAWTQQRLDACEAHNA